MPKTWLHSNQRVAFATLFLPILLAGMIVAITIAPPGWGRVAAAASAVAAAGFLAWLLAKLRRPLLARDGDFLLVRLGSGAAERVPLELVEVFFRGEGPAQPDRDEGPQASHIVVRLAERAEAWKHREVRRHLGHWCDGYITIRGLWCEPIDAPLLERLNRNLVAAHREQKQREQQRREEPRPIGSQEGGPQR